MMRISQLAERCGVPVTTLRFYETAGLVPAARSPAGYRLYGEDAVQRLAFIDAAKHLGLALEEISELLAVWESGACKQVKADLRPRIAARITDAERRTTELAEFTATLRRALEHLDALPDRNGRCDPLCAFLTSDREASATLEPQHPADDDAEAARWRTTPVARSLNGNGVAERAGQWQQLLRGAERRDIDGGVSLVLPAALAGQVAELAIAEQQCCPFFDFRLHFEGPMLRLEVRVPAEGADLLAELFHPAP